MAKPGPKPKSAEERKAGMLTARIDAQTRRLLEEEAQKTGLSLSRVVESRLVRSLKADEQIIEDFGSLRNYQIMRAASTVANQIRDRRNPEIDWLDSRALFDNAVDAIIKMFENIAPHVDEENTANKSSLKIPVKHIVNSEMASIRKSKKRSADLGDTIKRHGESCEERLDRAISLLGEAERRKLNENPVEMYVWQVEQIRKINEQMKAEGVELTGHNFRFLL